MIQEMTKEALASILAHAACMGHVELRTGSSRRITIQYGEYVVERIPLVIMRSTMGTLRVRVVE
jgi:hypothetical protein